MKLVFAALLLLSFNAFAEPINPIGGYSPIGASTTQGELDFGFVAYNSQRSLSVHLSNTGKSNVTLIHWHVEGFQFYATNNCPKVLAPGKACRFVVTYINSFPGLASGTLDIQTSAQDYHYDLVAEGQEDPINNFPTPIPFPPIPHR